MLYFLNMLGEDIVVKYQELSYKQPNQTKHQNKNSVTSGA